MTPIQLLKQVDKWLETKGKFPLSCDEIVVVVSEMMDATDRAITVEGLGVDLAVCTTRAVCKLRGWVVPE